MAEATQIQRSSMVLRESDGELKQLLSSKTGFF